MGLYAQKGVLSQHRKAHTVLSLHSKSIQIDTTYIAPIIIKHCDVDSIAD